MHTQIHPFVNFLFVENTPFVTSDFFQNFLKLIDVILIFLWTEHWDSIDTQKTLAATGPTRDE